MKHQQILFLAILSITILFISSCSMMPKNSKAVNNFTIGNYLGKWYEVARLENRFERNMTHTTANYTLRNDGKVKVVNSGFDTLKNKQKQAVGKAKFRGAADVAALKVSFFGPFYAGYNVLALDENYKYALVAGGSLKYLWILSREKTIPENVKEKYLEIARSVGYDTEALIWVKQD